MQTATENPSLKERKQQIFDTQELRRFVWDMFGCETVPLEKIDALREKARHVYEPLDAYYYRDREDSMTAFMRSYSKLHKVWESEDLLREKSSHPLKAVVPQYRYNIGAGINFLHYAAFQRVVEIMSDEQQLNKWKTLIAEHKIIGAYAQTELGHGSDVQNLETEAVYNPDRKEFTFNSPTLTSTKFYPGGMGKTANFIYVVARLKSNWRDHGTQGFLI